jgi:hypothetical protein
MLLRAVWRFAVNVPDEIGQMLAADHLADGHDLAEVVPIMIGNTAQGCAACLPDGATVVRQVHEQGFGRECIEVFIGCLGDGIPRQHHFDEGWGAHQRAVGEQLVQLGDQDDVLGTGQERALFVPGEVTYDPADAVHLPEMLFGLPVGHVIDSAQEFPAGETELVDKGVGHGFLLIEPDYSLPATCAGMRRRCLCRSAH